MMSLQHNKEFKGSLKQPTHVNIYINKENESKKIKLVLC